MSRSECAISANMATTSNSVPVIYLSVCSDFSQQEQGYVVNYANCQLRVALEGDFAATLDLPNNVSSVLAVVWYFDTDQPADFAVWEKDDALEARFEVVL